MTSQAAKDVGTTLAQNIRSARDSCGWTQKELAARANGVDALAVSRWERGESAPRIANLIALADATGRNLAWFYTDHQAEAAA